MTSVQKPSIGRIVLLHHPAGCVHPALVLRPKDGLAVDLVGFELTMSVGYEDVQHETTAPAGEVYWTWPPRV